MLIGVQSTKRSYADIDIYKIAPTTLKKYSGFCKVMKYSR